MKKYDSKFLKLFFTSVAIFFLVEIITSLFAPMLEGTNNINNILIDALILIIILSPFIWWLVKYTDRFEKELKESEERFRTLFEGAPDAIFLADPETGIIIDANSRASELIALPHEEIIGMHQARLHPPKIKEYSIENFKKLTMEKKQKEDTHLLETFVLRSDGTEVPVEVLAQKVNINGRPVLQGVFRDTTERKRTEDMLKKSKESFSKAAKIAHFGYWEWDMATNKLVWSDEVFRLYGLDPQKVVPTYEIVINTLSPETRKWFIKAIENSLNNDAPFEGKYSLTRPDGSMRYTHTIGEVIRDRDKKPITMFGVVQDITERKQAEEHIKKSLEEKEVLLREIHHRIKNNMQIVSSLLMLQSQNIEDKKYKDVFIDSQNRILSMALIHEKLYQSEDLAQIDFKEYINEIVSNIFSSYGSNTNVKIDINVEKIPINIDNAVPCGLIINELVTNSLKYAFPEGRRGEIQISVKSKDNNMIEMSIRDDGIGIPKDMDFKKTKSLGLHLVTALAENQLHGTIILLRDRGTEFQINFSGAK